MSEQAGIQMSHAEEVHDAVLRAKMALVECINMVEHWGADSNGAGAAVETDLWNGNLPLSARLQAVATEVAAVENLQRSRDASKRNTLHNKQKQHGGGGWEANGAADGAAFPSAERKPRRGSIRIEEKPDRQPGWSGIKETLRNESGDGGDSSGGGGGDSSGGAGDKYRKTQTKAVETAASGVAAAVAAVNEPPSPKKKKLQVRQQTRHMKPENVTETFVQQMKRYSLTTFGLQTIFSVLLLIIGLVYLTQRLQWTWQYSLYWCMMTALTVGYGDSPQCSTDVVEPPPGYYGDGSSIVGSGDGNGNANVNTSGFNGSWPEPPTCYGTGDRWEDMLFTMIFAFFSVTIIDSIIIEVLDRIERKERKLFAKVQRKLLELYTKAAKHAAKVEEAQARGKHDPAVLEQLMDDSLLVLDEEDEEAGGGADGADGVYRNGLHQFAAWLYRMSNHYANTRDAIIWVILVFIGVGFYMGHYHDSTTQDITFVSSLYWVIITGLAVGYGDFHPDDNVGYMFNFFYSFILFLWTFRIISQFIKAVRRPSSYKQVLQSTFDIDRMKSFDRDDDGVVTRDEYLAAVLVMLGQTDLETCDLILKYYDILDHDGDQVLTYEDIRIANERGEANMNHFEAASKAQKAESKRKSRKFRKSGSSSNANSGSNNNSGGGGGGGSGGGSGRRSQSAPPASVSAPATPVRPAVQSLTAPDDRFQEFLDQMELKSTSTSGGLAALRSQLASGVLSPEQPKPRSPGRAGATTTTTSSV